MKPLMVGNRSTAVPAGIIGKRRERLFFTGMALVLVITVFAGFARTYYLRPDFSTLPLAPLPSSAWVPIHGLARAFPHTETSSSRLTVLTFIADWGYRRSDCRAHGYGRYLDAVLLEQNWYNFPRAGLLRRLSYNPAW